MGAKEERKSRDRGVFTLLLHPTPTPGAGMIILCLVWTLESSGPIKSESGSGALASEGCFRAFAQVIPKVQTRWTTTALG